MSSPREELSRWRISLVLLMFLGLIRSGELTPPSVSSETSSTMSPSKRKSQDIGSLSDFTWHTWLLVDTQAGIQPGVDSTALLRRITPKSVFIAPALPACAEGYRADAMGRCVKSVNIDENAHINFLLERLNALYANQDSASQAATSKNDEKKSTGPLQLNIPLVPDSNPQSTKIGLEHAFSVSDPMVAPAHDETQPGDEGERTKPHEETTVTVYGMKNDTTLSEKTMFLPGNSSNANEPERKTDAMVVPIAEFVDETNDTNFSEIVDYKIPIVLKTLSNTSSVKGLDVTGEGISTEKRRDNSTTELSPTLVLLLSATKLPSVIPPHTTVNDNVTTLALTRPHNATTDRAPVSDLISNATIEDVITVDMADTVHSSTKGLPEVSQPIIVDEQARNNETHAEKKSTEATAENPSLKESRETEFIYDEEEEDLEYTYGTDVPEEEESTEVEGEEILKHGEAGMTFPTRNVERLHRDQQRTQQRRANETATDGKTTLATPDQHSPIRLNDSTLAEDKDETGSNVSSEVSIDGDLILETTLLDVNTESLLITTRSPDVTRKVVKSSGNDDFEESFGESPASVRSREPEAVFSRNAHDTIPAAGSHERKRAEHEELEAAPSSSESLLSNPEKEPTPEIRTIEQKRSNDNAEDNHANFPGYMRFPSSEVNSIHGPSYKQHSLYPSDDLGSYDSTSTKSSVPVRQKPVYYLAAPSWKPDRPQSDRVPATTVSESPMLLRFWSKMPLVRDPAIYPVDHNPDGETIDDVRKQSRDRFLRTLSSRRVDLHTESASRKINRLLTQKRGTPVDG
ncbi:hypothetical protein DMN91_000980 [Ooceraea biroi]|uniref:Folded gastrulation N-terminal domain-containing protein n=2 Tax=Ooceraea biroi TaxID=2015173 RepID=A0A3L8E362_OOCBI|nr:uncharacterized protein LOC113563164 [Ooceraea biroi]RLU27180.1 hypothetical protein DMN91_000980 [Ooceraea biroi]